MPFLSLLNAGVHQGYLRPFFFSLCLSKPLKSHLGGTNYHLQWNSSKILCLAPISWAPGLSTHLLVAHFYLVDPESLTFSISQIILMSQIIMMVFIILAIPQGLWPLHSPSGWLASLSPSCPSWIVTVCAHPFKKCAPFLSSSQRFPFRNVGAVLFKLLVYQEMPKIFFWWRHSFWNVPNEFKFF